MGSCGVRTGSKVTSHGEVPFSQLKSPSQTCLDPLTHGRMLMDFYKNLSHGVLNGIVVFGILLAWVFCFTVIFQIVAI